MKTNEAPEKIYVHVNNDKVTNIWNNILIGVRDIEYTRTDAFIEKACKFWEHKFPYLDIDTIKEFVDIMKGE